MTGEDVERSEKGLWVDSDSGNVVESPPLRGVQLVAPGGLLSPDVVRDIEAAKAQAPQRVEESVTDPEPEHAPKSRRAAKKG